MNDRAIARATPLRPAGPQGDDAAWPEAAPRPAPLWHRAVSGVLKALVPLAILVAAAVAWERIAATAPEPVVADPKRLPRLVSVEPAAPAAVGPRIEAFGRVAAARELVLSSEITGRLQDVAPDLVIDGTVAAGTVAFRLETTDLMLSIREAEARVAEIEARITMELGQGDRARQDFERLPLKVTPRQRSLILREPQMAELEAAKAAAVAQRERASEALNKAVVTVPFDAVVMEEAVEPGTILTAGAVAARLVATDAFETRVTLPLTALGWVAPGQTVRLEQPGVWPAGSYREGVVTRIGAALEEGGTLAVVTVRIPDPLALLPENADLPVVRLESYLRAEIAGEVLPAAVELPRRYLRPDDTAWVYGNDDRLELRKLRIVWRGAEVVLVSDGLAAGDRIVTTDLAVYKDGMKLRLGEDAAPGGATAGSGG
ncbi:MAG: HlyD family efflux transporter periplasmic adaptor subunit [Pseudomonadota bacterium]